jgi:hypothetical protein
MKAVLATLAVLTAAAASILMGQVDAAIARQTLSGLKGVCVAVAPLEQDAQQHGAGVTAAQLRTDVEGQLRQAGIVVLTDEDLRHTPGRPCLYVSVTVVQPQATSDVYAYHVAVELFQLIVLTRNLETFAPARTWNAKARFGAAGGASLGTTVEDAVHGMVRQFIIAFLGANPKQ